MSDVQTSTWPSLHGKREMMDIFCQQAIPDDSDVQESLQQQEIFKGRLHHFPPKLSVFFFSCHNFFSLSSVQIIFIPACCLLCVL